MKITELKIENKIYSNLKVNHQKVARQVKLSQKRIDIVFLDNKKVKTIEIKISDWRGGLRQAAVNSIACDESYVAVWHKHISQAKKNPWLFKKLGVGLMEIDEQFKVKEVYPANYYEQSLSNPYAVSDLTAQLI